MCTSLQTHFHVPQGSENTVQEYNIHAATLRFLPDPYRCLQHVYSYQSGATMTAPKCKTIYKALFFWRGAHTRLVLTMCMSTSYSLQWQSRVGAKALKLFIRMHQICEHLSKHYTYSHIFALC